MINPLSLPAGPPRLAFDRPWTLRDPLVVGRGTNTGQRYALAEPLYLSGRLSYLRTATQGYWPETPTIPVDRAARAPTLPPSLPLSAPHEALWVMGRYCSIPIPTGFSAPDAVLMSVMAAAWVSQRIIPPEDMPAPPAAAMGIDARLVDWQAREGLGVHRPRHNGPWRSMRGDGPHPREHSRGGYGFITMPLAPPAGSHGRLQFRGRRWGI